MTTAADQLTAVGLPFERVSAFDGRGVDPNIFPEYDEAEAMRWFGRKLSGAELGCYFSHITCAQKFLESDAEFGLALEDDLLIAPDLGQLLPSLLDTLSADTAPGWHMVNLGRPTKRFFTPMAQLETDQNTYTLARAHFFPDTTTAILWSRAGAAAFLETKHRIFAPIDQFLRLWGRKTDAGLGFVNPPITFSGVPSDINRASDSKDPQRAWFYQFRKQRRLCTNKWAARRNMAAYNKD